MIVPAEFDILVYWITERDRIRAAKDAGKPKPWTEDPLLRDFRWCNVRRMDDRVSRWLLDNWYAMPHVRHHDMTAATLARLVNWPDALQEIKTDPDRRFAIEDLPRARGILSARAARGDKVFTGAYLIPGIPGRTKVDAVMDTVDAVHAADVSGWNMKETWEQLLKFDRLGSFLAGQIVADLAHLWPGEAWIDPATWAPLGPGSARGMNRLHGRPKDAPLWQEQFLPELRELIHELKSRIPAVWNDRKLQAMDVQNCLCEFDKYRRLTLGEGKVRSRYDGRAPSGQGSMFA